MVVFGQPTKPQERCRTRAREAARDRDARAATIAIFVAVWRLKMAAESGGCGGSFAAQNERGKER